MLRIASFVFVAAIAATAAGSEAVDRICTPDELPSVTQPHVELSRVFARAEDPSDDPFTAPMGAMEVVVARINADGKVELSCVDDEAAARAFFSSPARRAKDAAGDR